jgi:protein-L-isoaspartate(D-aspartate) O-methyltransferase
MDEFAKSESSRLRRDMVETAVHARGVRSELVLDAMRSVPRESFLPERLREFAYEDTALPIEEGQTISQPYIVALMTEALVLRGGERVLEIGTGSGYAAAVLSEIAAEIYTVERHGALAEKAAATLADLTMATSTFCMVMARAAGRRTRPMTRSLLPPAARRFPNLSNTSSKSAAGW